MNNNLINNNNSNMFKVIRFDRGSSISSWMGGGLSMEGHKQIIIHEILLFFFLAATPTVTLAATPTVTLEQ